MVGVWLFQSVRSSLSRSRERSGHRSLSSDQRMDDYDEAGDDGHFVKLHGLPFNATGLEVVDFLRDIRLKDGKRSVHFIYKSDGKPNGDAFVEVESVKDVDRALRLHREHMGRRYIEVFRSSSLEMRMALGQGDEAVVKLRGLPYEITKEEIANFFSGMEIIPNGIGLMMNSDGKTTGVAYVQFASPKLLSKALEKHNQHIRHRYIEVFKSTVDEAEQAVQKQLKFNARRTMQDAFGSFRNGSGGAAGGGSFHNRRSRSRSPARRNFNSFGGRYRSPPAATRRRTPTSPPPRRRRRSSSPHPVVNSRMVQLRGLPYTADRLDIVNFLRPLTPIRVHLQTNNDGKSSGNAQVEFASPREARESLGKHRQHLGSRYIEVYMMNER